MSLVRWNCLLLVVTALSGCSQLPADGPAYRDIVSGAAARLTDDRHAIAYDYALIDVTPVVLDALEHVGSSSLQKTFQQPEFQGTFHSTQRIGVGDVLQVSVFESGVGGLFLPADVGPRPANFVTIPTQTVGSAGFIKVPFAGAIHVAGRAVHEIERDIERKLAGRAIEPQAVITVVERNSASVSVVGETLNGANKFKLMGADERILDMISRAGGTRFPAHELFVVLHRQGRQASVRMARLVADPGENIKVQPGDTVYVYRDQERFVAVGALGTSSQTSGLTGQFAFDQERLTLNEALARAGGLQDSRANPAQIFVYRVEQRDTLAKTGVDLARFAPDQAVIPTVYRISFRDPSSYFSGHKFMMRNKDIIYAANADAVELGKFLAYVRLMTSTASGVSSDVALTRDVLRGK